MEVGPSTLIEDGDSRPQQRRSPRGQHGGPKQRSAVSSSAHHDGRGGFAHKGKVDGHAATQQEEEGFADDMFGALSSKAPLISTSRGGPPSNNGPLSTQRSAFKPVADPQSAADESTPNAHLIAGADGESPSKRPTTAFAARVRAAELCEASAVGWRSARPPAQPQSLCTSSPRAPHVYGVGYAEGHARRPATAGAGGARAGPSPSPSSPSASAAVHPQRLFAFTMPSGEPQYMPPTTHDGAYALPSPPSSASGANVGRSPRLAGGSASPAPLKAFPPAISSLRWRAISREGDSFTRNLALSASAVAAAATAEPFASPLLTPRRKQVDAGTAAVGSPTPLSPSALRGGAATVADAVGHGSAPATPSRAPAAAGGPMFDVSVASPPASAANRPSSARQRPKPTPATFRSPQQYAQRFPGAILAPRSATRRPDSAPSNRGQQRHYRSSSVVAGGEDVNWSLSPSAAYRSAPAGGEQPPSTPSAPATARGDEQSQRSAARRGPSSPRGSSVFPPTRSIVVPDPEAPMRYWLAPAPAH